jgi:beta-1,3-galactosyltransferase 1
LSQENFVDSYNNLTLKSMFMLKFATNLQLSTPFGFLLKVDDDAFVNVRALVKYSSVLARLVTLNIFE